VARRAHRIRLAIPCPDGVRHVITDAIHPLARYFRNCMSITPIGRNCFENIYPHDESRPSQHRVSYVAALGERECEAGDNCAAEIVAMHTGSSNEIRR
jgi:hypothetical protein